MEVDEAKGNFLLPDDTSRRYASIGGGIGIKVFRCTLRYVADERLPHRITLVYSNRDRESAAFLDELLEPERDTDLDELVLTMTDDRAGTASRGGSALSSSATASRGMAKPHLLDHGPTAMVDGVVGTLKALAFRSDSSCPTV
jgi:ferredoxin-NADP reductase